MWLFDTICSSRRFLDVLAARKDPAGLTGEVLIDGAPQPPNFKCLSGYVVQVGETDGVRAADANSGGTQGELPGWSRKGTTIRAVPSSREQTRTQIQCHVTTCAAVWMLGVAEDRLSSAG